MDFNFEQEYSKLSNTELLKITKQPELYRKEAVLVAERILTTRKISDIEQAEAQDHITSINAKTHYKKVSRERTKSNFSDAVQSVINPLKNIKGDPKPVLWVKLLVLVNFAVYLYYLPIYIRILFFEISYASSEDPAASIIFIVSSGIQVVYTPLYCYLLLKRKKAGWIITLLSSLALIIINIITLYSAMVVFKHSDMDIATPFFAILFNSSLIYFLQKKEVMTYFNIGRGNINYNFLKDPIVQRLLFLAVLVLLFVLWYINEFH